MFLGEHEHTIDDKNRLTLPARFRDSFPDGLVLTRGMDSCITAHPRADWDRLVEQRLGQLDPLNADSRTMQRYFFSSAAEVAPDRQGRVMVPGPLLQYAGITRDVVVAGVYDHLEIWDRAAWRELVKQVEGRAEDVAERVARGD